MDFYTLPEKLPQKILVNVFDDVLSGFIGAFKTNIKPNATIPLLWMVIHKKGIRFCNSHKTRGLFRDISVDEIDSFKIKTSSFGHTYVKIIFKDIKEDDFYVDIPGVIKKEILCAISGLGLQII